MYHSAEEEAKRRTCHRRNKDRIERAAPPPATAITVITVTVMTTIGKSNGKEKGERIVHPMMEMTYRRSLFVQ